MLVDGGRLGLMWNGPDPACAWDSDCYRIAHPSMGLAIQPLLDDPPAPPGFALVRATAVAWSEVISRDDYLRRWLTISTFMAAAPEERAELLSRVEAVLDAHPDTVGRDVLDLSHRTAVLVYDAR